MSAFTVTGKIQKFDLGLDKILQIQKDMDKGVVYVGLPGDSPMATVVTKRDSDGSIVESHESDTLTVATLGVIHELGLGVPSRPFMAKTWERRGEDTKKLIEAEAKLCLQGGRDVEGALKEIGVFYENAVKESFTAESFEPLADSTIARKGSSVPLIDTGTMRQSITSRVDMSGERKSE